MILWIIAIIIAFVIGLFIGLWFMSAMKLNSRDSRLREEEDK